MFIVIARKIGHLIVGPVSLRNVNVLACQYFNTRQPDKACPVHAT